MASPSVALWLWIAGSAAPREYVGPAAVSSRDASTSAGAQAGDDAAEPAPTTAVVGERRSDDGPPTASRRREPGTARRVVVPRRRPERVDPERAGSVVTREEIDERLSRSAPDALSFEPGAYVQQTAHGQASVYLRGLTGQQTVLYFDGVRLNTSTFRQGPNQYFFTIDSRSLQKLEVLRGAASTRYGSDAMGGALLAGLLAGVLYTKFHQSRAITVIEERGGNHNFLRE